MPSYLVETYLARGDAGERAARELRARRVTKELARERTLVRFNHSIYVPEDEICFFVFEAPTRRAAVLAAHRAELAPIRVVEAELLRKESRKQ
ncbi:MAG TPA: hypothetical protein VFJ93_11650 [Gaiellaceae bacterium]|nr:hypothetical protein [Gaiellaceae bacterium]